MIGNIFNNLHLINGRKLHRIDLFGIHHQKCPLIGQKEPLLLHTRTLDKRGGYYQQSFMPVLGELVRWAFEHSGDIMASREAMRSGES